MLIYLFNAKFLQGALPQCTSNDILDFYRDINHQWQYKEIIGLCYFSTLKEMSDNDSNGLIQKKNSEILPQKLKPPNKKSKNKINFCSLKNLISLENRMMMSLL